MSRFGVLVLEPSDCVCVFVYDYIIIEKNGRRNKRVKVRFSDEA